MLEHQHLNYFFDVAQTKKRGMKSRSQILVPQSVSLQRVRTVVEAVVELATTNTAELAAQVGCAPRQILYAISAAKALELLDDTGTPTVKVDSLLHNAGPSEYSTWQILLSDSRHIRTYAHDLFLSPLSHAALASRIESIVGYSPKTAQDRAATLLRWKRLIEKKVGTPAQIQMFPGSGPPPVKTEADSNAIVSEQPQPLSPPDSDPPESIPQLRLPRRFEKLEQAAKESNVDVSSIVIRVEREARRVDSLLRYVQNGRTGQFEVFFGATGSGKTTFLRTLPKFFENICVKIIGRDSSPLLDIPEYIKKRGEIPDQMRQVYIIDERDNDRINSEDCEDFFERLRILFRNPYGEVLVIWPVTSQGLATQLSQTAYQIGGDSLVPNDTKGLHHFAGMTKEQYYEVADITAQNLNGKRLETFGVTREMADEAARESETIGSYLSTLENRASALRHKVWNVLREKPRLKLWILVAGDQEKYLNSTVAQLVHGVQGEVDLNRILAYLDDKQNNANYLKAWRKKRHEAAFLLNLLDVRIVPLPPTVTVAAVKAFGADAVRTKLAGTKDKLPKRIPPEACHSVISRSRVYKMIIATLTGNQFSPTQNKREHRKPTEEYLRIQQLASKQDKLLNHALGSALEWSLNHEGHRNKVLIEKRKIGNTNLQPDIQIFTNRQEILCLEPTWRTSGTRIEGELGERQNTMKPGKIQQYMLDKVYEYVKALDL